LEKYTCLTGRIKEGIYLINTPGRPGIFPQSDFADYSSGREARKILAISKAKKSKSRRGSKKKADILT